MMNMSREVWNLVPSISSTSCKREREGWRWVLELASKKVLLQKAPTDQDSAS